MSLRTRKEHANFKETFAKQQAEAEYNSEPARLIRENERLIREIDAEQRALSLHESQRGRKDPHLNLPLPKIPNGRWTAQEIEDRVSMSWSIFKADHLTAKNLALSPKGMVTLGGLMDANPGDYANPNVIKMLFDRALRTGALQMGEHVINTAEPAPAPEPVAVEETNPHRPGTREADAWDRNAARRATITEILESPVWMGTLTPYIQRGVFPHTEATHRELFRRVSNSREGVTKENIERHVVAMFPGAETAEQKEAREDDALSASDYIKKRRIPVADVRSYAPRLRSINQPVE